MSSRRPWQLALAVTLAAPFLLLGTALPPGRVLSAADGLLDAYLLAEARPEGYRRANELVTDPYRQFLPWQSLTSAELRAGRIPFWNPYAYAGSPLLGNAQSGVFDPLALPYLLVSHPSRGTVWVAVLRLMAAGVGTLLLARALGASPIGATLAAIIYSWGGFTVTWLLSPHTSSSAWLPWTLLATERIVASPTMTRSAALALPLALGVFGGHVEVAFFSAVAAGGYALVRHLQRERPVRTSPVRVAAAMAVAAALSVALAAVQVLPFLEALQQGVVVSKRTIEADAVTIAGSAHPERAITQVFPYLQGRPLRGEVNFWTPTTRLHGQVGTYGSVLGCLLAAVAWVGSPRRAVAWALGAVGVIAWAYSASIPPLLWLGSQVPVLQLASAQRIAPVALCALALLAGLGLDRIRRERGSERWTRLAEQACIAAGALAIMVAVGMLVYPSGFASGVRLLLDTPAGRGMLGQQATGVLAGLEDAAAAYGLRFLLPWGAIAMASGWALGSLRRLPDSRSSTIAVLAVAADLFYFGAGFNPSLPVEHDFPETAALADVRAAAADGRALMLDEGLPANAATYYRIPDVLGYDEIDRWRLRRLLEIAGPFGRMSAFPHADSWVHDLLSVRVVTRRQRTSAGDLVEEGTVGSGVRFTNPGALPVVFAPSRVVVVDGPDAAELALRTPAFDPSRTAVVESPARAGPATLSAPATVFRPYPGRLEVSLTVASRGMVVVSEGYDPGWSAWVDGAPVDIRPADLAVMALVVPAGRHHLELQFRPRTWRFAVAASAAAMLAIAVIGMARARTLVHGRGQLPSRS